MSGCNYYYYGKRNQGSLQGGPGTPEKRNLTQSWRWRGGQAGFLEEIHSSQHDLQESKGTRHEQHHICLKIAGGCHRTTVNSSSRDRRAECWIMESRWRKLSLLPYVCLGFRVETLQSGNITPLTPSLNTGPGLVSHGSLSRSQKVLMFGSVGVQWDKVVSTLFIWIPLLFSIISVSVAFWTISSLVLTFHIVYQMRDWGIL